MSEYITFPALGLELPISPTIVEFSVFGVDFSLKWYGLLIAIGFLLAVIYAIKRANYFEIDPDRMIDVVLVSALFAFIGARLYYVLFSDDRADYFESPLTILQVWNGGLAIYGGIIFAFITAIWMCKVRKVNVLSMFDISALGFLIGQSVGRWGNFFNQEAYGGNTTLPWGMSGSIIEEGTNGSGYTKSLPVHPTFLYESLWCLLGFVLLHFISKKAYRFKGQIFTLYIVWYGIGRFMIEGLRTDSLYFGEMRISQLVAAFSVMVGIALFFLLRVHSKQLPKNLFAEEAATLDGTIPVNEDILDEAYEGDALEESEDEGSEDEGATGEDDSKDEDIHEEEDIEDLQDDSGETGDDNDSDYTDSIDDNASPSDEK